MRMNSNDHIYELHTDATMEQLLAVNEKYTPKECYDYWVKNIHPNHKEYVLESIQKMLQNPRAVQIEFAWIHPTLGEVMVRFSGKHVKQSDGMHILEGYYRIISDVNKA